MKKNLIFLMLILFTFNASFAKIWRVNNTGVPTDFTTAQAAMMQPAFKWRYYSY